MTYFAIICSTKTISSKFGDIKGINHLCYIWGGGGGEARVMIHIGAGHSNNCQTEYLNCSDMTYFPMICSTKNFKQIWRYQRY